jgi:excisionase family DNA binding protein
MATEDFDVDSLAAYLHMMPPQIARLAERGKIPSRRVGGQWKFSRAEVHHWLEQRIGFSGFPTPTNCWRWKTCLSARTFRRTTKHFVWPS